MANSKFCAWVLAAVLGAAQAQSTDHIGRYESTLSDKDAILQVTQDFRDALVNKDGKKLAALLLSPQILFSSPPSPNYVKKRQADGEPTFNGIDPKGAAGFIEFVATSKTPIEEKFYNIKVTQDGHVAWVSFDFEFLENNRIENYGLEAWQLLKTVDGSWKIFSVVWSSHGAPKTLSTATISDPAYRTAQRLVPVEGTRRLNIYCTGSGSPTVVLDAGLGDSARAWGLVQPEISPLTRTCAYDRAGLGFSDPSNRAGTSANIVDDLHRLLGNADIQPPYVLVGHSFGGMNVKLFARTYTPEVAGMVLVDPSHEDQSSMIWDIDPESKAQNQSYLESLQECKQSTADWVEGSDLFKRCVGEASPRYTPELNAVDTLLAKQPARRQAWVSEFENIFIASSQQLRSANGSLGDMPIIVLTKEPAKPTARETQAMRDAKNQGWIRLHNHIATLSPRGARRTVVPSGHYIQQDQPEAVVAAIRGVVLASRASKRYKQFTIVLIKRESVLNEDLVSPTNDPCSPASSSRQWREMIASCAGESTSL